MKLTDFIVPETICVDLSSTGKIDVLSELGRLLTRQCAGIDADSVTATLVERERLGTTGIGNGVAIPHGRIVSIDRVRGALGISRTGVPFDAVDGMPVHIFAALLAPTGSGGDHLRALALVSHMLKDPEIRQRLMAASSPEEAYEVLREEDGKR